MEFTFNVLVGGGGGGGSRGAADLGTLFPVVFKCWMNRQSNIHV